MAETATADAGSSTDVGDISSSDIAGSWMDAAIADIDKGDPELTKNLGRLENEIEPNAEKPREKPVEKAEVKPEWDKKLKIKIDGKEEEKDLNDERVRNEIARDYQLRKVSDERMRRATEALKAIDGFAGKAKNGEVFEVLKDLGIPEDQLTTAFENWYYNKIQESNMTPEQKQAMEYKRRNDALEAQFKEQKIVQENESYENEVMDHQKRTTGEIIQEAEKRATPKVRAIFNEVLYHKKNALEHGYEMPTTEAFDHAIGGYEKGMKEYISGLTPDQAEKILGDELISKLRGNAISKIRNTASSPTRSEFSAPKEQNAKPSTTFGEFEKMIKARAGIR